MGERESREQQVSISVELVERKKVYTFWACKSSDVI